MVAEAAGEDTTGDGARLLDALRDYAVLELAPDGALLSASAGAAALFGRSAADLIGLELPALFDLADGRRGFMARLRAGLTGKGGFREELPLVRRGGEQAWVSLQAYPVDPKRPAGAIAAVCRDATAERQRRSAERRLLLMTQAARDYAAFLLSPGGVVVEWNAGAERLMGHAAEDVVGRGFACFYAGEDRAAGAPAAALETARRAGVSETEGWRVRADGGRFWAWTVIDLLRDEAGEPAGFALTIRDITERRVAQDALRHSEQQFRQLVNGVRDYALYMLDPNGIVVSWNSGAERIKGYRDDEVIGQHYAKFFTETDRAAGRPAQSLYAAQASGRFEGEGWRVRKDGSLFWASVVINAIRNETGELVGFAKITRDATERRRAETELAKTQERLFHAQKLEALGQLTGGIAHDFNNLLMVMGGQARKLRRSPERSDIVARAAETIEAAAERGAALTRQLLSFARRQNISRTPFSLAERIGAFQEILAKSLGGGARLEVALPANLWPVEADPSELEVAMINLAVNARDAMPEGGVLTVSAENVVLKRGDVDPDLEGEFVALRFADTGIGVPPDLLPKIFDPFFTTKQPDKGTGLGLSQVYGFGRQVGGTATAESVLGRGTAIVLYLPRAQAQSAARPAASPARARRQGEALVVEDNPDVAEVTADLVKQLGYRTRIVQSADAALQILDAGETFDLVVSDVVMAGSMDGLALAAALKARFADLPIVLVSGYPKSAGAVGESFPMLSKPFKLEELERAVAAAQPGVANPSNVVRLHEVRRPPA